MGILNITSGQVGLVGVLPSLAYIQTTDTLAEILVTGYLNKEVANGVQFNLPCLAEVSTQETPTSAFRVGLFQVAHVGANWSLVSASSPAAGVVTLPTKLNHIAIYSDTSGTLAEDASTAINGGNIQAGFSGTAGFLASFPATLAKGSLRLTAVANTGDTLVTISNALHGQASVYSIPDSGASTANILISKLTGTQHITVGGLQVDAGVITSGISTGGQVGSFVAFPTTASKGSLKWTAAVNATGDFSTTVSNATAVAQNQVISIPDSGAATANFVLDTGTSATGSFTKLSSGATPVPFVDPGSCTITAVAGAANTSTITVQLKDGAGVNIARKVGFTVYSSSAADGLTLQTAASTGYSVASGGLSLNNGGAITTQIRAITSASGACVLSLLDTAKLTSYLVLVVAEGSKTSAQLSAGSYG
jgi:hypothetical protein